MVPPELRQDPHVSFTQLDTYLRCPLRYRLQYVDRVAHDFVPAALALGSGIHGAAAFLFGGIASGERPGVADVQAPKITSPGNGDRRGHASVTSSDAGPSNSAGDVGTRSAARHRWWCWPCGPRVGAGG